MFWTITLITTVIFLCYRLFVKPMYYWRSKNVKQSPPTPLFGDNYRTSFKLESFTDLVKRIYFDGKERYYGIYLMTTPILLIKDPKLIKQITVKDFDHFTDHRNFIPEDADPLWSKNLFALKGDNWRDMRSTLSPAFTSSKMRSMFTLINECAEQYSKYYLQEKENEIVIEIKDSFTRYANDVIATCAFGIKCDSLKERDNEFYLMGKEATDFKSLSRKIKLTAYLLLPSLSKIFNFTLFTEAVSNFFQKIIKDTLRTREEHHIIRPDMIHLLMEARKGRLVHEEETFTKETGFATVEESHIGKSEVTNKKEITDLDITAQALIFFFAGFETVSTLMTFMAYELAVNPDVQEKLRNEIIETKEACKGKLNYDDMAKMKYMDMVMSETLRKWPPVIAADRVCVKPYTIEAERPDESPVHVKAGDLIWLAVMGIHYDPEFYPNPDSFNPERFSEENKHNIQQCTYLPFGVGPRNCIGSRFALMETKAVFYYLLQNFEITVVGKTVVPIEIDKKQFSLAAEGGCWLGFKKRQL